MAGFDSLQEYNGRCCVHLVINYIFPQSQEYFNPLCNEILSIITGCSFGTVLFPLVQFEKIGWQCRTNEITNFKTECEQFNILPRCLDMHPNSMTD